MLILQWHKTTIILEDDVSLEDNFKEILAKTLEHTPADMDILYLDVGIHAKSLYFTNAGILLENFEQLPQNEYVVGFKNDAMSAFGTHAYVITLDGARKVLQSSKIIRKQFDIHMMSLSDISIYVARKKMLYVDDNASTSEIAKMGRQLIPAIFKTTIFWKLLALCNKISSLTKRLYSFVISGSMKIYDAVYVINLERTPERFSNIKKQLDGYHIECTRFDAVDGYLVKLIDKSTGKTIIGKEIKGKKYSRGVSYYVDYNGKYADAEFYVFPKYRFFSAGEIGVAFSHRAIWNETVKNNYKNVVVLEDDVILSTDFKNNLEELIRNIPEDADITFLGVGRRKDKVMRYPDIDNIFRDFDHVEGHALVAKIQPTNLVYGTYAYIISAKGAKKLLKLTECSRYPLDDIIFQQGGVNEGVIKAYVAKKDMCIPDFENSEIKKMGRPF
jgi:glycosyl transferase family 25